MQENDTSPFQPRDIAVALGLLTRLPIRLPDEAYTRGAQAGWAYPLVGVSIGFIATGVGLLTDWMGLPAPAAALAILATMIVTCGAMHEDGLADCADGFWGGWERIKRLEIMKDSQIGTYGVIALVLSLAARWFGLTTLVEQEMLWAVIGVAALSRAGMPVVMGALPHARDYGLSHAQGRPDRRVALAAVAVAAVVGLVTIGWATLGLLAISTLAVWGVILLAKAKINGQTGDVLGATQQVLEVLLLMALIS